MNTSNIDKKLGQLQLIYEQFAAAADLANRLEDELLSMGAQLDEEKNADLKLRIDNEMNAFYEKAKLSVVMNRLSAKKRPITVFKQKI